MEDNGVHLTSMIFCPSLNFEPCSTVFKCSVTVGHRSAVYMGGGILFSRTVAPSMWTVFSLFGPPPPDLWPLQPLKTVDLMWENEERWMRLENKMS